MNNFTQEETMDIRLLYVLYNERGWTFECEGGRIARLFMEGRKMK